MSHEHQGFEFFSTLRASKCIFYYWATERKREREKEREREESNDLNISICTYYEEWKFNLKTETLPAGAQEDITDNRKTGKNRKSHIA